MNRPDHVRTQDLTEALRAAIEAGEWAPGDAIPTTRDLRARYGASGPVVSRTIQALKREGVLTGVAGGRTRVRIPRADTIRNTARYSTEKRDALKPEADRACNGVSESDSGIPISDLYEDNREFQIIGANAEIARILEIDEGVAVLRRTYTRRHKKGAGIGRSISHIPVALISSNPALLDPNREPWPGGTMNQFLTVNIEPDRIVDRVTADMPTAEESSEYDVPPGIPMIRIKKITYDTTGRPIELVYIPSPADTMELVYETTLPRWTECQ